VNRTTKQGYNVMRVKVRRQRQGRQADAVPDGFMTDEKADPPMWGRPV